MALLFHVKRAGVSRQDRHISRREVNRPDMTSMAMRRQRRHL